MDFMGQVNLFHGRMEAGKAVFGSMVVEQPQAVATPDGIARIFVRPYDLDIHQQQDGRPALRARVDRVQLAGPQVRVELTAETGEAVTVEMAHAQFRAAQVSAGDEVFVSLRDARVFTEDYAI